MITKSQETFAKKTKKVHDDWPHIIRDLGMKLEDQEVFDAYQKLNLRAHATERWFDAKCERATASGLQQMTEEKIVRLMVDEHVYPFISRVEDSRDEMPYFYDPLFKSNKTGYINRMAYQSSWAAWWANQGWKKICRVPLSALNCQIPKEILTKLAYLKEMDFFNCMFAFARESMLRGSGSSLSSTIPIVVTAAITRGHSVNSCDKEQVNLPKNMEIIHYFIGAW
jgi:hypothetical protein